MSLLIRTKLSQHRVRELLDYNQRTGSLTWRVDRGAIKAGDEAGTLRTDGNIMVTIDRRQYLATRLVYLYVTGDWPDGRLTTHNRKMSDLRWVNIMLEKETWARTPQAAYQREYRRRVKSLKAGGTGAWPPWDSDDPRSYVHVMRARHVKPSPYDRDSGVTEAQLEAEWRATRRTSPGYQIPRGPGRPKGSKNRPKT